MNKFQFIKHLLDTKKFTPAQKERFFKLVSAELADVGIQDKKILEDIQLIKEQIGFKETRPSNAGVLTSRMGLLSQIFKEEEQSTNQDIKTAQSDRNKSDFKKLPEPLTHDFDEKFHDRKKVNNWLKYFTRDNTAIKFSTHIWDEDLYGTYEDYIGKLNDEYQKYDFHSLQKYSPDLYWNKINPFLFQKKLTSLEISGKKAFGWGRYKIGIGWQYPFIVKEFCQKNFDNQNVHGKKPHTLEIPPDLIPNNIPGKTIKTFENVIDLFKPEIEFRDNQLWVGIKTALKKTLPNHSIDNVSLEKLKGCSFYTNTEYVLKAISRIFNMVKSRSNSKDIKISCFLDLETNQYILEIVHLNSYSDMNINHPKLLAEKNGDISILRTTLLSLCDFSIESRFKNENGDDIDARIEYLYDNVNSNNWQPKIEILNQSSEGFKFILKFLV